MTTAQYHCPLCSSMFQCDASLAGQQVTCPTCSNVVTLPEAPPDESVLHQSTGGGEELQLGCPICSGLFQTSSDLQGSQVICPHCGNMVTVPHAVSETPPDETTASLSKPRTAKDSPAGTSGDSSQPAATGHPPSRDTSRRGDEPQRSPVPKQDANRDKSRDRNAAAPRRTASTSDAAKRISKPDGNAYPPTPNKKPAKSTSTRRSESNRPDKSLDRASSTDGVKARPDRQQRSSQTGPAAKDDAYPPPQKKNDSLAAAETRSSSRESPKKPTELRHEDLKKSAQALLPPSVNAEYGVTPGERAPLPTTNGQPTSAGELLAAQTGAVVIPTETGYTTVREPVKKVLTSEGEIELRRLSPEEKKRRRRKKNLILWAIGALVLIITVILLLYAGPL